MIHTKQWHLDEAERLTDQLATLTSELDLTQPAMKVLLESVEVQIRSHLAISAAMVAAYESVDLCARAAGYLSFDCMVPDRSRRTTRSYGPCDLA